MYLEESSTFLPSCVRLYSLCASFSRSFREVEITLINPETTQERVFTVRPQNLLAGPFLNGAALFCNREMEMILEIGAGMLFPSSSAKFIGKEEFSGI